MYYECHVTFTYHDLPNHDHVHVCSPNSIIIKNSIILSLKYKFNNNRIFGHVRINELGICVSTVCMQQHAKLIKKVCCSGELSAPFALCEHAPE